MLQSIIEAVSGEVGDSLINKIGLNKEQATEAIESTGEATAEVAKNQLSLGNIGNLMNLFSSKPNNSAADGIQNQIAESISEKLDGKMGFSSEQIQSVIQTVLPVVMGFISKKNEETPDDDDSPLQDLFGSGAGDFVKGAAGNILGKFF
jgi:hypothetical protein